MTSKSGSKKLKRGDRGSKEEEFSSPKRPSMASSDENLASATPAPAEEFDDDSLPLEPSLAEIKGILNSIQETVNNILRENQKLKEELKELKASSLSHDRELDKLKEALATATKCNDNLKVELENTKKLVHEQTEQVGNLQYMHDNLEQYSRKNSLELHGIPEGAYESPEEAVLKVAEALDVQITPQDIEITHKLKRRGNKPVIVKFANHKKKTQLYKARIKLKDIKVYDTFPNYTAATQETNDRIYINENLTQYRRDLVSKASKMKRDNMIFSFWMLDGNVYMKTSPEGHPVRIYDTSNLEDL